MKDFKNVAECFLLFDMLISHQESVVKADINPLASTSLEEEQPSRYSPDPECRAYDKRYHGITAGLTHLVKVLNLSFLLASLNTLLLC